MNQNYTEALHNLAQLSCKVKDRMYFIPCPKCGKDAAAQHSDDQGILAACVRCGIFVTGKER